MQHSKPSSSTNTRAFNPKDVFYQVSSSEWSPVEITKTCLEKYKGSTLDEIEEVFNSDLQQALDKKRGALSDGAIESRLKLFFETLKEHQTSTRIEPQQPKLTEQWTQNFSTKKQSATRKNRSRFEPLGPTSPLEVEKKKYSFFPSALNLSVSSVIMPRLGATETQAFESI